MTVSWPDDVDDVLAGDVTLENTFAAPSSPRRGML
jgi:hypothetical protein